MRCPTCHQMIPEKLRRFCGLCGKGIKRGHRYTYAGSTVQHRDCIKPYGENAPMLLPNLELGEGDFAQ